MLTLIRNAQVFTPAPLGVRDVLVSGAQVLEIAENIRLEGDALRVVDAAGLALVPGFVDALTHPAGGGGEGGYANRTAEIPADAFIGAGITSPVGALGTDALTRSLDVLYGQVMHLRSQGLAAYMYGGSYRVPVTTLTGDVVRDLVLVDPVIGFGEVAIADHRGSQVSAQELRRLAADTRLGGTISGKGGTVLIHVGEGPGRLSLLREALHGTDLAAHCFYPTHCNRNAGLLADAFRYAGEGGWIDVTASTTPEFVAAGEVLPRDVLAMAIEEGVPMDKITVSSDAGGSLPDFESDRLLATTSASPDVLLEFVLEVACDQAALLPQALAAVTSNPAAALGLQGRGKIAQHAFADLLLLDLQQRRLEAVMCGGRWLHQSDKVSTQ